MEQVDLNFDVNQELRKYNSNNEFQINIKCCDILTIRSSYQQVRCDEQLETCWALKPTRKFSQDLKKKTWNQIHEFYLFWSKD